MRVGKHVGFHKSLASSFGFVLENPPLLGERHFVCFTPKVRCKTISVSAPTRRVRRVGSLTRLTFHDSLDDPDQPRLRFALNLTVVNLFTKYPCFLTRLTPVFVSYGATLARTVKNGTTSLTPRLVGLFETDALAALTFSRPFVSALRGIRKGLRPSYFNSRLSLALDIWDN